MAQGEETFYTADTEDYSTAPSSFTSSSSMAPTQSSPLSPTVGANPTLIYSAPDSQIPSETQPQTQPSPSPSSSPSSSSSEPTEPESASSSDEEESQQQSSEEEEDSSDEEDIIHKDIQTQEDGMYCNNNDDTLDKFNRFFDAHHSPSNHKTHKNQQPESANEGNPRPEFKKNNDDLSGKPSPQSQGRVSALKITQDNGDVITDKEHADVITEKEQPEKRQDLSDVVETHNDSENENGGARVLPLYCLIKDPKKRYEEELHPYSKKSNVGRDSSSSCQLPSLMDVIRGYSSKETPPDGKNVDLVESALRVGVVFPYPVTKENY